MIYLTVYMPWTKEEIYRGIFKEKRREVSKVQTQNYEEQKI